MLALTRLGRMFGRAASSHDMPLPEPEAVYTTARPITGFFAGLTVEQKARALAYRGPEAHGDPSFMRRPSHAR
jgi:hypothetical protein